MENLVADKKKPGRPRKSCKNILVDNRGIVAFPEDPEDIIELVYQNPSMFKKIFTQFKGYNSKNIQIDFQTNKVIISGYDHLGKTYIYACINPQFLHLYYCSKPRQITIDAKNIDHVINSLEKDNCKLSILMKAGAESTIFMVIHDIVNKIDEIYEIDLLQGFGVLPFELPNLMEYPLRFELESRHFKKKISDISRISKISIKFQYYENELYIGFDNVKNIQYNSVYREVSRINLKHNILPDSMFSITAHIDRIEPFSSKAIGTKIRIYLHDRKHLCFQTDIDANESGATCELSIYADAIDLTSR